jgi:hypothetical protein
MRAIDLELERASEGLHDLANRIPDREWTRGRRRVPKSLVPLIAAVLVLALVGVPAFLMRQEPKGAVGGTETTVPGVENTDQEPPVDEVDEEPGWSTISTLPPVPNWESGLVLNFEGAGLAIEMDHTDLLFAAAPVEDPETGALVGLFAVGADVLTDLGWNVGTLRAWPVRGSDGELLLYEDGTITIRGDKSATVLRHVESRAFVGLRWTESPGVDLVLVSVVGDLVEQAEGIITRTIAEYQRHVDEQDRRVREGLDEAP